jgi:hypothetical protein
MKQLLRLIQIGLYEESQCVLVIDDCELFDFISDYLGDECDLPHESQSLKTRPGGEVVAMYFPQSVASAAVEECLMKLSPIEIERIYSLNH